MNQERLNPVRLDEKEFKTDLGQGEYWFVGSSCDMWATEIPNEWIDETLNHCLKYPQNKYLFQTKNPYRLYGYIDEINRLGATVCTTIESNRNYKKIYNKSPMIYSRMTNISGLKKYDIPVMLTIEPILDFDIKALYEIIKYIEPGYVNIGADSQRHDLPEPEGDKLQKLISMIKDNTNIVLKSNLNRLRSKEWYEKKSS